MHAKVAKPICSQCKPPFLGLGMRVNRIKLLTGWSAPNAGRIVVPKRTMRDLGCFLKSRDSPAKFGMSITLTSTHAWNRPGARSCSFCYTDLSPAPNFFCDSFFIAVHNKHHWRVSACRHHSMPTHGHDVFLRIRVKKLNSNNSVASLSVSVERFMSSPSESKNMS